MNITGELIGINTAIFSNAEGIGFAIPINKAKRVINDLLEKGTVPKIWLGIRVQDINEILSGYLNLSEKTGALVSEIIGDSPASKSDLRPGDVIRMVDRIPVEDAAEFYDALRQFIPGDPVTLTIIRKGSEETIRMNAVEFPEHRLGDLAWDLIGIRGQTLSDGLRRRFRIRVNQGVIVSEVKSGSPAAEIGLRAGDVVTRINDIPLSTVEEFHSSIRGVSHQNSVMITVVRGNVRYRVVLELNPAS